MRNKEKYARELAELACNEPNIAVSKATGNPFTGSTPGGTSQFLLSKVLSAGDTFSL